MASYDLKDDVAELQRFLGEAKSQRVKDVLNLQIQKWQMQLIEEEGKKQAGAVPKEQKTEARPPRAAPTKDQPIVKKLRQYAWDQSDKFVKLYVEMPRVHEVGEDNIKADFQMKYLKLSAVVYDVTYELALGPFHAAVAVKECKYRVKTNKIVIMLKKEREEEKWPKVIGRLKKKEESDIPSADKDPHEDIMEMFQEIYNDGDEKLKQSFNETFYKSRTEGRPDQSADS